MNVPSINQRVITVPLEAWLAAERLAGHANSITTVYDTGHGYKHYHVTDNWRDSLLASVKAFDKAKNIALADANPEAKETVTSVQAIIKASTPIKPSEPVITLTDPE